MKVVRFFPCFRGGFRGADYPRVRVLRGELRYFFMSYMFMCRFLSVLVSDSVLYLKPDLEQQNYIVCLYLFRMVHLLSFIWDRRPVTMWITRCQHIAFVHVHTWLQTELSSSYKLTNLFTNNIF